MSIHGLTPHAIVLVITNSLVIWQDDSLEPEESAVPVLEEIVGLASAFALSAAALVHEIDLAAAVTFNIAVIIAVLAFAVGEVVSCSGVDGEGVAPEGKIAATVGRDSVRVP
jgi:hypothetical protein